ncbi:MAG: bifunctional metallophosphatase/5'-nucleotidase [Deltaproteobacteria bacterium]|nr:bifunctional metallophosphatase/5'-nucleotidase [Deltaproteobacteria bacterium]
MIRKLGAVRKPDVRWIYIDIDDVLSHTAVLLGDLLAEHHDRRVPYEEITHFDLGVSFGLDREELERFLDLAHEPEAIGSISIVEGAVSALGHWLDEGYEIHLLTGRPPGTASTTRAWLEAHGVPHSSLSFVNKYGRSSSGHEGPPALGLGELAAMEFCLAVEDSLDVAVYLAEQLGIEVALMDHPWNRDTSMLSPAVRERIVRCRGWSEIIERFPAP